MSFFDLNIPYTESRTNKQTRLKQTIQSLQLGYTGIAFNHTITTTMTTHDHCSISLFPLSSILKLSPSISNAVTFHRHILNAPLTAPFRQFTRLTVVVDSLPQGAALNSGNPVIKSYDIVAVKPLKQDSFEQACRNYEVDIIAIDFSENRFRLKQPLIKAAIERGVYFEITYSGLVMDAQLRRQIISNAKLLVDWTRGKNIIFSSAAPSVSELRGPYDVANLACLLGFSLERAKASVSKTCRSLLESALRKKRFYKEAIRIELISPSVQSDGFDDWLKWDPISSGEGDLQLDDMAKSFAASSKESKTVKAIDFTSIIDELPSHGLHIKDIVSESKPVPDGSIRDADPVTKFEKPAVVYDKPTDCKPNGPSLYDQISVMETLENENLEDIASVEGGETCAMIIEEETKIPSDPNTCFSGPEIEQQNLQEKVHEAISEAKDGDGKVGENTCSALLTAGMEISFDDNISSAIQCEEDDKFPSNALIIPPIMESKEADAAFPFFDAYLREEVPEEEQMWETGDVADTPVCSSFPLSGVSLIERVPEESMRVTGEDVSVATLRSHDEFQNGASSLVHEPSEDVIIEVEEKFKDDSQIKQLDAPESSSERAGRKQGTSRRSVSFPFKRLLKPSYFKKVRKPKTKGTILSLNELTE